MTPSSPATYSTDDLINTPSTPGLGPNPRPDVLSVEELKNRLQTLERAGALSAKDRAELVFCVALIWNDHWTPAHELAQDIHNPDGSLLHAILHRREPDYWNSKYWLRRVGRHPALPSISEALADTLATPPTGAQHVAWFKGGLFDPFEFVDACERVSTWPDQTERQVLEQAQAIELKTLLRFFAAGGK